MIWPDLPALIGIITSPPHNPPRNDTLLLRQCATQWKYQARN
jgi:hypothetical protein